MDRYAIFVDAGYAYAAGGDLVLDTPNRHQVALDPTVFIGRLREIVERDFPRSGDFLRVYWYDAAPRGMPLPEHDGIAAHAGVKVRLGRLTRQGQKGVDSLVLRDMMRLSAEHAICTAFLFAGDEDLRQGVIEAQDYGVKVVLLGIQPTFGQNQAESLVHETDDLRVLTYAELEDCFSPAGFDRGVITFDESVDAYAIGSAFGEEWVARSPMEEVRKVAGATLVPPDLHGEVIRRLLEVGDLPPSAHLPDGVIAQAREGFRGAVRSAVDREAPKLDFEPAPVSNEPPTSAVLSASDVPSIPVGPAVPAKPTVEAQPVAAAKPAVAAKPVAAAKPIVPVAEVETPSSVALDQVWAFSEGREFGRAWLDEQPQEEVRYLRANFPYLPRDVDVELLRRLVREMGLAPGAQVDDADRKAARAGFWQTLGMELDLGPSRGAAPRYEDITERDPVAFGRAFARQWAKQSDPADVERARNLLAKRVGLPSEADAVLLRMASHSFGDPVPVNIRHRLRDGFRDGLESL